MPVTLNVTILNPLSLRARIVGTPTWRLTSCEPPMPSATAASGAASLHGGEGVLSPLDIRYQLPHESLVWPWVGTLGVQLVVHRKVVQNTRNNNSTRTQPDARDAPDTMHGTWSGIVTGTLTITLEVVTIGLGGNTERSFHDVHLGIRARVVRAPPRHRRLLWDLHSSIGYPSGFFPNDDLAALEDGDKNGRSRKRERGPSSASGTLFDWHGDSVFTNHVGLYRRLRRLGYFMDILTEPFECFNAAEYVLK